MLVAWAAADPRLVSDDRPGQLGCQWLQPHRFTDAVAHEPGCLVADFEFAVQLVGRNPILVGDHEVHGEQPLVERDVGPLEDRPDQHRELALARPAFPHPPWADLAAAGLATLAP